MREKAMISYDALGAHSGTLNVLSLERTTFFAVYKRKMLVSYSNKIPRFILIIFPRFIPNSAFYPQLRVLSPISRSILNSGSAFRIPVPRFIPPRDVMSSVFFSTQSQIRLVENRLLISSCNITPVRQWLKYCAVISQHICKLSLRFPVHFSPFDRCEHD
jgi:hypothetical protein